ncbi:uncharacterized protein [Nicotiana sylvestris]|uniref:uncharacterized protein n=1 Tax=Nicotiana sylvestris TaxID=4096 RepID=UPI00388C76D7
MKEGEAIQEMYIRFTTLTNKFKSLGRIISEEDKVEKILTRVLSVTWESKITAIQESNNIATFNLDELIENLTAYELRRQNMKMDVPKKERSLELRITKGFELEDDEMTMITKDFKKYLMRGKGPSRSGSYSKPKERAERRNRKKEHVQPKKNKGSTKVMVVAWGESSDESSDDEDGDEQALMAIGESDEESENQVHALESNVLELRFKNLKLKLGAGKKKADHTQLTLEKNVGKMKDELYKRDEKIRVLKEDLSKVQVKGRDQIWYMDSGCSKHMTGNKNQFLSLEDLKGGNVSFENGKKGEIIGVGKGKRVNNVYILDLSTLSRNELTCLSVLDNDPLIWHKILGHASLSQLNKLVSKDLVIRLPNMNVTSPTLIVR